MSLVHSSKQLEIILKKKAGYSNTRHREMSKKNLMNHLLLYIKSKQEIGSKRLIKRKKKKALQNFSLILVLPHPALGHPSRLPSLFAIITSCIRHGYTLNASEAICKVGYWRDIGSVGVGQQLAGDIPERGGWVNGGGQGQLR